MSKISNAFNKVADYLNDRPAAVFGTGAGVIWSSVAAAFTAAAVALPALALLPILATGGALGMAIGHRMDKKAAASPQTP